MVARCNPRACRAVFALVAAVLVLAALACGSSTGAPANATPTYPPTWTPDVGSEYMAEIMCQKVVKQELVAPRTAKFPATSQIAVVQFDPNVPTWTVHGFVDAQNRFGAMIRTNYRCEITYQGQDNWHVEEFAFIER